MGYERKRGKLADLNALAARRLTGIASHSSSARRRCCRTCKYVITLDTDTQLPRDSARQFVGAMAHPLNRAAVRRSRRSGSAKGTASCSRASP